MKKFNNAFIVNSSKYLPGEAVDNNQMDKFIAPINRMSDRIKKRILNENGILSRHYGINENGESTTSVREMAAHAIRPLLNDKHVSYLSVGSTGQDCAAPGIANFVQSELQLPPLETLSVSGICAASMSALSSAAEYTDRTEEESIAAASEFPSRLFKSSRFKNRTEVGFDAHFLRWMLSDGAGAVRISSKPSNSHKSLKINWIHTKSFSSDFPTCMQVGLDDNKKGYLDYHSLEEAEKNGGFDLKQDIRILPALFDIGIGEYVKLVQQGFIVPKDIKKFLCHYSSEKFKGIIKDLMEKANLLIDENVWFSNLKTCGNTGSASIFIILEEFWKEHLSSLKHGDQVLIFVPESGKFTVSYALLEVVDNEIVSSIQEEEDETQSMVELIKNENTVLSKTLIDLAAVWQDYRSFALRTPIAQAIFSGNFNRENYLYWMENWIPQVREGSIWMHRTMSGMNKTWKEVTSTIREHIGDEQFDWQVLYEDYVKNGGNKSANELVLSPGGEALNAYMHRKAKERNGWELLGGIYIIEGTGNKIIPLLLPKINEKIFSTTFLTYHGENDINHLHRWLWMLEEVLKKDPSYGPRIVQTAKEVASLYLIHWQYAFKG